MDIQEKEVLIAEIEQFKEEALKMHIVQVLAHTYTITNLFDYSIDSDGSVIWYKAQACQLLDFWQAAKAQAVPEGFVLIEDDTKTVVAIERMVEQQVEASGMDSRRLERLDGWKIIEAAKNQDDINAEYSDPMCEELSDKDKQRLDLAAQKREAELFG